MWYFLLKALWKLFLQTFLLKYHGFNQKAAEKQVLKCFFEDYYQLLYHSKTVCVCLYSEHSSIFSDSIKLKQFWSSVAFMKKQLSEKYRRFMTIWIFFGPTNSYCRILIRETLPHYCFTLKLPYFEIRKVFQCFWSKRVYFIFNCGALHVWYHVYNLKNVKSTHGRLLLLVNLKASVWNFSKINTPLWVFFRFLKLNKWCQMAQSVTNNSSKINTSRGCLCDNWKPSFLPHLIFNWRTFSRRVTARWWRQWAKNQVLTN